jgi:hypothetical protein
MPISPRRRFQFRLRTLPHDFQLALSHPACLLFNRSGAIAGRPVEASASLHLIVPLQNPLNVCRVE